MKNAMDAQSPKRQLALPKLISDGMVLQRDADVRIWGWAEPGESITVEFIDKQYSTEATPEGNWEVILQNLKAGGPFDMEIKAISGQITIRDILIGEVWVCTGQSNMELPMARVKDQYPDEMVNCENPLIRTFNVAMRYGFNEPYKDLNEGSWISSNQQTISEFSAVGYFFAKALFQRHHIPVGFIKAAIGGSPIESWISEEALKTYPDIMQILQPYKDDSYVDKILEIDGALTTAWFDSLNKNDAGLNSDVPWYSEELNTYKWSTMNWPANFEKEGLRNFNGAVWLRKEIDVPEGMANKPVKLWLGRIVDSDKTYVNGEFVGEFTYQYPPRKYDIPAGLLKKGKNLITVRIVCNNGIGEVISGKPYKLFTEDSSIDLTGEWKYMIGTSCGPLPDTTFIQWQPAGLYNGMLAPLTNYTVKGALWYQGESNTSRPFEYLSLMKTLVEDWRKRWNQSNFPFIFVQLPNYSIPDIQPAESQWAELREAQLLSLEIPDTAMAIAIDLGEWNDIHPLRKKEVGERLALAAINTAYGEKVTASGPIYSNMEIAGNKIAISFINTGGELKTGDGAELKHFAIAGSDKIFLWAKAKIEGEKVIVWNENIAEPKSVRYAWATNPEGANLVNSEGLPASPFRTDV